MVSTEWLPLIPTKCYLCERDKYVRVYVHQIKDSTKKERDGAGRHIEALAPS